MSKTILELTEQEVMRLEAILMDQDETEALRFLKEVLRPKLRAKGAGRLDPAKSTGVLP